MAESHDKLNSEDTCKAGTSSNVESEYAFNMRQCSEALKESSKYDSIVDKALNGDGGEEEEDDDEFSEAKDSIDSDVEYDDDYLKECYKDFSSEKLEELKAEANKLKNEGNDLYRNQSFKEAIKLYTQALNKCPLEFVSERSILYANRAAVKVSLEKKEEAVLDCNKAIELNPTYVKAILRRANVHRKLENLEKSLEDYQKVLELDKDNREARQACATLPGEINEKNEKLKAEMFGKLKELGNMVLNPFGLSTDNFKVIQDPNTGGYSISMEK